MSTEFINDQWRLVNQENKSKQSNYSMDFDSASSDYIDVGNPTELQLTGALTFSCWIKTSSSSYQIMISKDDVTNRCYNFGLFSNGQVYGQVFNSGSSTLMNTTTSWNDGNWHHIAFVYIPSTLMEIFIDGNSQISSTSGIPSSIDNDAANFNIGRRTDGARYFDGQLDAVAIFDYALTDGTGGTVNQIAALYGSSSTGIGNPMSLSPKPVAMYNLGDKSAFNGANYLVPNIAAEEADGDIATSYSPYALDFDAASVSYVNVGNDSSLNLTSQMSVSIWAKPTGTTQDVYGIIANFPGSGQKFTFEYYRANSASSRTLRLRLNSSNNTLPGYLLTYADLSDDKWHHLAFTVDGTTNANGINVYVDGAKLGSFTAANPGIYSNSSNTIIGAYQTNSTWDFDGYLSNASIWDTALTDGGVSVGSIAGGQIAELYNEGVPSNLNNHSAYSNLVSWWQLGSNSSFNTNWTVLDEKGSNNGTSVNMGEDSITDGVNSYANGVSSGMSDNIVGSAPFSDANSLSYNMDVLDRVEDTPS